LHASLELYFQTDWGGIWIDDEEFYIPYIPRISNYREWREIEMRWLWYYNIIEKTLW